MQKLTARGLKLTAPIAIAALLLTGCSGDTDAYDEPEELEVAMSADVYNEEAQKYGDPQLSLEQFEEHSKTYVCDQLPEEPSYDDFIDLGRQLEEDLDISIYVANALTTHGAGTWCEDKAASGFPDVYND